MRKWCEQKSQVINLKKNHLPSQNPQVAQFSKIRRKYPHVLIKLLNSMMKKTYLTLTFNLESVLLVFFYLKAVYVKEFTNLQFEKDE